MSFSRNYSETLEFLDEFRSKALPDAQIRKSLSVDLTKVEDISIPVAVVLAAEFQRWSLVKNIKLKPTEIERWNGKLIALFNDLGVFKLLGLPEQNQTIPSHSYTLSPLESGLELEGERIHSLQMRFRALLETFTPVRELHEGLIEATENAISHAYPKSSHYTPRHPYAGHRWWAVGCLDFQNKRLRFFVFDQGAGIPTTIPRTGMWETIVRGVSNAAEKVETASGFLGSRLSDHGYILEKAFEVSRTRTGKDERGLGLDKMRKVIDAGDGCRFRIISGKGEIRFENQGNVEIFTHSHHIGGTLLEWSFPSNVFEEDNLDLENE